MHVPGLFPAPVIHVMTDFVRQHVFKGEPAQRVGLPARRVSGADSYYAEAVGEFYSQLTIDVRGASVRRELKGKVFPEGIDADDRFASEEVPSVGPPVLAGGGRETDRE